MTVYCENTGTNCSFLGVLSRAGIGDHRIRETESEFGWLTAVDTGDGLLEAG